MTPRRNANRQIRSNHNRSDNKFSGKLSMNPPKGKTTHHERVTFPSGRRVPHPQPRAGAAGTRTPENRTHMHRRWKIALGITSLSALAMTGVAFNPAAAARQAPAPAAAYKISTTPQARPGPRDGSTTLTFRHPRVVSTIVTGPFTVQPGQTLASIAQAAYGTAGDWPTLWQANRVAVPDPDDLPAGIQLTIPVNGTPPAWLTSRADAAAAPPPPPSAPPAPGTPAPPPSGGYGGWGTPSAEFTSCVISRESGGNPQIWNPSGHWGLFQFAYGTWVANGGPASEFGNAGAPEQYAVYYATYAADGPYPWSDSDGC
jgi:hypothetical protein